VTSTGADAKRVNDSTAAFNAAISSAVRAHGVDPAGHVQIPGHISVNNVTIAGAGMWYSIVSGAAPASTALRALTEYQRPSAELRDFGDVQERDDSARRSTASAAR